MSRRKPELQAIDVNAWPTVAHTELDEPVCRKFEARRQAILRYIAGEPIRAIEKSTHFNRRQLYRWLDRAQAVHLDGRPFGFRALIHYVRIAEYSRGLCQLVGRRLPEQLKHSYPYQITHSTAAVTVHPCHVAKRSWSTAR